VQRAEGIAATDAAVRRALPDLVRDVRALQTRQQAFAAERETLDQPLGQRYFAEWVCLALLPRQMVDLWIADITGALPPERR